MPLAASDIKIYGSANHPENDSGTAGGAIDTTVRFVPDSASLFNSLGDTVEVFSSAAGDTTQTVTVTGRNAGGEIVSEPLALAGTSVVNGATVFASILKIVVSASHAGTITVRKATGDATIVAIEPGVLSIRRPFYDVAADAAGGSERKRYEKVFVKNTHGTLALLGAQILEQADAEAQIAFALAASKNDSGTSANRATAPAGLTFDSSAKNVPGGNLAAGEAIGVWLELTLPAGDPPTVATYTLRVSGTTT
jgi:hypothetical protein